MLGRKDTEQPRTGSWRADCPSLFYRKCGLTEPFEEHPFTIDFLQMKHFFVVSRRVLLISIAALLCTSGISNAEERIFGTILDEDGETYLVEAEDGTRYKVEWNAGSTLWSVGDEAILTTESGMGFMVYGTNHTYVSMEETDLDTLDESSDEDQN
jgi:hypothetical protein